MLLICCLWAACPRYIWSWLASLTIIVKLTVTETPQHVNFCLTKFHSFQSVSLCWNANVPRTSQMCGIPQGLSLSSPLCSQHGGRKGNLRYHVEENSALSHPAAVSRVMKMTLPGVRKLILPILCKNSWLMKQIETPFSDRPLTGFVKPYLQFYLLVINHRFFYIRLRSIYISFMLIRYHQFALKAPRLTSLILCEALCLRNISVKQFMLFQQMIKGSTVFLKTTLWLFPLAAHSTLERSARFKVTFAADKYHLLSLWKAGPNPS